VSLPHSRIAVLLGGPSAEHEVSLVSGRAIAAGLRSRGHDVSGWLIDRDRRWWSLPDAVMDPGVPVPAFRDPVALGAEGPWSTAAALERLAALEPAPVAFPAMHGPFGEDGVIQSLLESAGIVYCGSDPAASAVGMDKTLFKRICGAMELPTLPWVEVRAAERAADPDGVERDLAAFARDLPDPRIVVKPAHLGSSIGISIVHRPAEVAELRAALDVAFAYDDLVLAEPYLAGARELEVSVLGNTRLDTVAYGPGEIFPGREFYDYIAKYHSTESRTEASAVLDPGMRADALATATAVYLAIGASGFGRVDFLLSRDGLLFVSEINTVPGFTPISLFPLMCAEGGYDFADTCERIVELALEAAAHRPPPADLPATGA
jgi:D-alanine-D-alanine ligase